MPVLLLLTASLNASLYFEGKNAYVVIFCLGAFLVLTTVIYLYPAAIEQYLSALSRRTVYLIGFLSLLAFMLACYQYYYFDERGDSDLACYLSAFWNAKNGNGFLISSVEMKAYQLHSDFVYLFITSLVFNLFSSAYVLFLIQSFLVFLTVYLFHRFISTLLGSVSAMLLSLALLFYPGVMTINLFAFHPVVFIGPLLMFAVRYFFEKQFSKFTISLCLCLLVKENIFLITLMFAWLSVIEKRSRKWIGTALFVSLVYGLIIFFAYFPLVLEGQSYRYAESGNNLARMLHNAFLREGSYRHLVNLFMPVGIFPALLSRYIFLPVLIILQNLVLNDEGHITIWRHYSFDVGILIFVAAALGIQKITRQYKQVLFSSRSREVLLCLLVLLMTLINYRNWFPGLDYLKRLPILSQQRREVCELIPSGRSLMVYGPYLSYLFQRKDLYDFIYSYEKWREPEFLLLDLNYKPSWFPNERVMHAHREALNSRNYVLLFSQNDIYLLKKQSFDPALTVQP